MSSGRILSGVHAKWKWRDRMGVGWRSCLETHGRSWGFWFNNCNHNLEQVGKCLLVGDGYDGGKLSGDMTYLYPGFTIGIVGQYQGGHLRAGREAVLVKHRIWEKILLNKQTIASWQLEHRLGSNMASMAFLFPNSPQFEVPGIICYKIHQKFTLCVHVDFLSMSSLEVWPQQSTAR